MIIDSIYQANRAVKREKTKLRRSVAKSITWRIVGTIDTIVISWAVTGKMVLALSIGSIEVVTKMILYVIHERVWERISWGNRLSNSKNISY
jgi:uncharacterized membrane protein